MNLLDILNFSKPKPVAQPQPQPNPTPQAMNNAVIAATNKYPSVFNFVASKVNGFVQDVQQKFQAMNQPRDRFGNPVQLVQNPTKSQPMWDSGAPVQAQQLNPLASFIPMLNRNPQEPAWMQLAKQLTINKPQNMVQGGIFGAGFDAAGNLMQGQMPTAESLQAGAKQGMDNSWVYGMTSPATQQILTKGSSKIPALAKITDQGLGASKMALGEASKQGVKQYAKQLPQYLAKNTLREVAESPLESVAFAAQDSARENIPLEEAFNKRAIQDLLGNLQYGGIKSVAGAALPGIKAGKTSFMNQAEANAKKAGVPVKEFLQQGRLGKPKDVQAPGGSGYKSFKSKDGKTRVNIDGKLETLQEYTDALGNKKTLLKRVSGDNYSVNGWVSDGSWNIKDGNEGQIAWLEKLRNEEKSVGKQQDYAREIYKLKQQQTPTQPPVAQAPVSDMGGKWAKYDDVQNKLSKFVTDNKLESSINGWFNNADTAYKPNIGRAFIEKPELKTLTQQNMFETMKAEGLIDKNTTFEKFLDTPVTLYRSSDGTTGEFFSSYTPIKKVAEQLSNGFGIKPRQLTNIQIKPKDTYGILGGKPGELEVLVPTKVSQDTYLNWANDIIGRDKTVLNRYGKQLDDLYNKSDYQGVYKLLSTPPAPVSDTYIFPEVQDIAKEFGIKEEYLPKIQELYDKTDGDGEAVRKLLIKRNIKQANTQAGYKEPTETVKETITPEQEVKMGTDNLTSIYGLNKEQSKFVETKLTQAQDKQGEYKRLDELLKNRPKKPVPTLDEVLGQKSATITQPKLVGIHGTRKENVEKIYSEGFKTGEELNKGEARKYIYVSPEGGLSDGYSNKGGQVKVNLDNAKLYTVKEPVLDFDAEPIPNGYDGLVKYDGNGKTISEIKLTKEYANTNLIKPEIKIEEPPLPTSETPNAKTAKPYQSPVEKLLDGVGKLRKQKQDLKQLLTINSPKGQEKNINKQVDYFQKKLGYQRLEEARKIFETSKNPNDFFSYLKQLDNKPAFPDSPEVQTKPIKSMEELLKQKPETKTTQEVKSTLEGKTTEEKFASVKTEQQFEEAGKLMVDEIQKVKDTIESRGKTWEQVVDELQSGNKNAETELITQLEDIGKRNAELDLFGRKINVQENYWTRKSQKSVERILTNPLRPKGLGNVLVAPDFSKKRTGVMVDYVKTPEALLAYLKESFINRMMTKDQKAEFKLGLDIKDEIEGIVRTEDGKTETKKEGLFTTLKGGNKIDFVSKIEKLRAGLEEKPTLKTYDESNDPGSLLRSTSDRAAMMGTKDESGTSDFWQAFIYPFRNAQKQINQEAERILKSYTKDGELYKTLPKGKEDDAIAEHLLSMRNEIWQKAVQQFTDNVKGADLQNINTKKLVNDIFDEFVAKDIKEPVLAEQVMGQIRAWTGRGALGLNVASAIQNIFEVKRGLALGSPKAIKNGVKSWFNQNDYISKYIEKSELSTALERKYNENNPLGKAMKKMDKALYYMFDKTERAKDNLFLAIFEEQGKEKGLEGENLTKFVLQKFDQYAIKYGKGNDVGMFKSPLMKTVFQFNQYALKDMVIAYDKAKGAYAGDKGDRDYMIKYATASIAQMGILYAALGTIGFGGKTGTFIDSLMSAIVDKEVPLSPIAQIPVNFVTYLSEKEKMGDGEETYGYVTAKRNWIRSLYTVAAPASNQLIFKSGLQAALGSSFIDEKVPYGYLEDRKRGFSQDYAGRVANELSDKPQDMAKGFLFGTSYDPKRKEYFRALNKGEKPGLSETETAAYKSLPTKEAKTALYESAKARDAGNKLWEGVEARVKSGKTENIPAISIPAKDATKAEVTQFNSRVKVLLDAGLEPSSEELKAYYFRDVDAMPESTISQKQEKLIKRFAKLKTIADSDIDEGLKDKLIDLSGLSKEDASYYREAKKGTLVNQLQYEEKSQTMKREDWLMDLAKGRRVVGDVQLADGTTIDGLYEKGLLEDGERDFLKAIRYDVVTNKYYLDRDYKGGTGTGVSYGGKELTPKQLADMIKFDMKLETMGKPLSSIIRGSGSKTASPKLLSEVLSYKPQRATGKTPGYLTRLPSRGRR